MSSTDSFWKILLSCDSVRNQSHGTTSAPYTVRSSRCPIWVKLRTRPWIFLSPSTSATVITTGLRNRAAGSTESSCERSSSE